MSHFKKFVDWARSPQGRRVIMTVVEVVQTIVSAQKDADDDDDE